MRSYLTSSFDTSLRFIPRVSAPIKFFRNEKISKHRLQVDGNIPSTSKNYEDSFYSRAVEDRWCATFDQLPAEMSIIHDVYWSEITEPIKKSVLAAIYKSSARCPELVATHGNHIHAIHACWWRNSTCKCGISKLFRRIGLGGGRIRKIFRKKNFERRRWKNYPKYFLQARRESISIHIGTCRWILSSNGLSDQDILLEECQTRGLLASRGLSSDDGLGPRGTTDGTDATTEGASSNRSGVGNAKHCVQGILLGGNIGCSEFRWH